MSSKKGAKKGAKKGTKVGAKKGAEPRARPPLTIARIMSEAVEQAAEQLAEGVRPERREGKSPGLGVQRLTPAQAAAQAQQILSMNAEARADNAERAEAQIEEAQASMDAKHGGAEQKRAVDQELDELTPGQEAKLASMVPAPSSGFQRRSLRAAIATGIKAVSTTFTADQKRNLAPIPEIRGSRISTIDEKKLKTYLQGNQGAYDALVTITTDLVGKKADIQKRVTNSLKQNKTRIIELMFVPKTEEQKLDFNRLARNRQERLAIQLQERQERLRASRALVQQAIQDATEGKAPALQQVTRTAASSAVEAEGKAPVLEQDPALDGKHGRPGGEVYSVRGARFAPLNQAEAKRTTSALLRRLPVEQRTVVQPFVGGLNDALSGRISPVEYAGGMSTAAALFLLGGMFNLLPSLSTTAGQSAFQAITAIIPLMAPAFRSNPSLRGIVGEDGTITRESIQNIDLTQIDQNSESMNRQEILSALALAQGALVERIREEKAEQADLDQFRDALNILWQRSATNTTPNQLRLIRGMANNIRDSDNLAESIVALQQRLLDATVADDAKSALYRDNRAIFEGYNAVDIYNVVQAMRDHPENQDVDDDLLRARVFNTMLEGRQGSLEAKRLFAESGNLGGVEAGEAQIRDIVAPSPTMLDRIRNAQGLPLAALSSIVALLRTGDISSAAVNLALASSGAAAGGRVAQQRGRDPLLGQAAGVAAANVADYVTSKFIPKAIKIDPSTRIPAEQVEIEQQDIENSIKGSGTLKPKFIVPSASAFKPTPAESSADQLEFDMFDYIRPTSEGDGFTIAESNIKMSAYRNEQMRMNGGGMTYAPSWGEQSFDKDDDPINPKITEAALRGNVIPANELNLPTMETDFGDYEVEEHQWNPSVGLQRLYAPQPTPITGLNTTLNQSLLYGIVP